MKPRIILVSVWIALRLTSSAVEAHAAEARAPVFIGLDAAFSLKHSTSAQSLEYGAQVAIHQINKSGGVLHGRPLELVVRDNHSVPARGIENFRELAELPELVAVLGGRFSVVVMAQAKLANEKEVPLLAAWSSANGITTSNVDPSLPSPYVFRLSLRDSLAMPVMLGYAQERGFERVGVTLLATAWGQSNQEAARRHVARAGAPAIVKTNWIHWREQHYAELYAEHLRAGAQAIVIVGNDEEVAGFADAAARRPPSERLPMVAHWGVTGGDFQAQISAPEILGAIDLSVVQTFSFETADPEKVAEVMAVSNELFGLERPQDIAAPVGFAHAYDLVRLLGLAIEDAGTTERSAVRDALERVRNYRGLVRHHEQPFSPSDHEALDETDVFMARYTAHGSIVPVRR